MTLKPTDPDKIFGYWIGRLTDLEDFDESGDETLDKAITALSALGETFIPRLINAMTHDYLSIHFAGELVLVRLGPETAPRLMEPLEHCPNVAVRMTLAHILCGWFADVAYYRTLETVGQILIWYRPNPPEQVPELSKALKEAIPSLIKALKDEDWDVRLWAAKALSLAGADAAAAAPVLLEFLREAEVEDKAENYVPSILGALVNTGCKDTGLISVLLKMLRSSSPDMRKEAAAAFIEIGPSGNAAVPALTELLADETTRDLRQADRLSRVLRMLQLLMSRGRWTRPDIAAEQECSERTVYRDLVVLELAGIPVEKDPDNRFYRVRQDFRFPSLPLTEEEALGQGTAASITAGPGLDINAGAGPVSRKLTATNKEDVSQVLADAEQLVSVLDLKLADHTRHRDIIRTVQWALVKRKQLTGTYRSPHEPDEVKLQLHPYRLCLVKQAWYLIAQAVGEHKPQTYRVARFKTLRMLEANAQVPEDFDLAKYFGNAWAVYRGDKSYDVEIVFTPEVATTVNEVVWHPTQKVLKHKDGSVTLTFKVDGLNEIIRWVLGWGSRAKVIQPSELREMVLTQFHQSIEVYRT